MKLVTSRYILEKAKNNGYALGAFNIYNLELLKAVVKAASDMKSPVIIQTTTGTVKYAGANYLVSIAETAAEENDIPIVLHFDHASDVDLIKEAVKAGYTSVMIDGSRLPYEENVEITSEVVEFAHKYDAVVEAELGKIGGTEDDMTGGKSEFTDPDTAVDFVKKTGIDSLAVAIGTAHGLYDGEPSLDFERLKVIRGKVNIPLVLHGASGVGDESLARAVDLGINKVNIATELKIPFADKIKEHFEVSPEDKDPRSYLKSGMEAVTEVVRKKIKILNAEDRADFEKYK